MREKFQDRRQGLSPEEKQAGVRNGAIRLNRSDPRKNSKCAKNFASGTNRPPLKNASGSVNEQQKFPGV